MNATCSWRLRPFKMRSTAVLSKILTTEIAIVDTPRHPAGEVKRPNVFLKKKLLASGREKRSQNELVSDSLASGLDRQAHQEQLYFMALTAYFYRRLISIHITTHRALAALVAIISDRPIDSASGITLLSRLLYAFNQ